MLFRIELLRCMKKSIFGNCFKLNRALNLISNSYIPFRKSIKMRAPFVKLTSQVSILCKRDLGISVPAMQKASDPIQQLFLDKLKEFKSKSAGGKLVDPSPELEKEMKNDQERIYRQFGFKPGDDLSKIPSMSFKDPNIQFPAGTKIN